MGVKIAAAEDAATQDKEGKDVELPPKGPSLSQSISEEASAFFALDEEKALEAINHVKSPRFKDGGKGKFLNALALLEKAEAGDAACVDKINFYALGYLVAEHRKTQLNDHAVMWLLLRFSNVGGDVFDVNKHWRTSFPYQYHATHTLMHWAAGSGDPTWVAQVLEVRADHDLPIPDLDEHSQALFWGSFFRKGYTPLHSACDFVGMLVFAIPLLYFTIVGLWGFADWGMKPLMVAARRAGDPTCKGGRLLLLEILRLRDMGRLRFTVTARTRRGSRAIDYASSIFFRDALFLSALKHDIAEVPSERHHEVDALWLELDMCQEFIMRVLGMASIHPFVAATRCARAAQGTPIERDAREAASTLVANTIGACTDHENETLMRILFLAKDGGLTGIENLAFSGLREPFDLPVIEQLVDAGIGETFAVEIIRSDYPPPLTFWILNVAWWAVVVLPINLFALVRHTFSAELPKMSHDAKYAFPWFYKLGLGLIYPLFYTLVLLQPEMGYNMLFPMTWGIFRAGWPKDDGFRDGDWYTRGGVLDGISLCFLCSTLLFELDEFLFKASTIGAGRYLNAGNAMDVGAALFLALAFLERLFGVGIDAGRERSADADADYAPESALVAVGLLLLWLRALMGFTGEWRKPAVLQMIMQSMIYNDITQFLVIQVSIWIAFGLSASALNASLATFDYEIYDMSFSYTALTPQATPWAYVAQVLLWPVAGVETDDFDFDDAPNPGERFFTGPLLMSCFGVLVVLVGLNLLIAMMSSTYEAVLDTASTDFVLFKVERILDLCWYPRTWLKEAYVVEFCLVRSVQLLRLLGVTRLNEPWGGWRRRGGAFYWDRDSFWAGYPKSRIEELDKAAAEAMKEGKEGMVGGWESSVASAKKQVARMQLRRDGVPTRENVHAITRNVVGDMQAEMNRDLQAIREEMKEHRRLLEEALRKLGEK